MFNSIYKVTEKGTFSKPKLMVEINKQNHKKR